MIVAGRSLYTRLVMRVGIVLAISSAVLLIAIWISTQLAANEAYDRILSGSALQIAENTWYQNGAVNVDVPLAAFSMLTAGDQVFYVVIDPDGRTVAGDPDFKPEIPWNKLEEGPLLQDGAYLDTPVRMAVIGRRMPVAGAHPWAVIVLAQTNNARMSFAKSVGTRALLVILAMGVLTLVAAMFTLYQALSPLKKIEAAIRERDLNDLSPLSITVPVETHALVSSINAFMQRLAIHRATMRRVIGDAAHQLRTPVTALISQMELLSAQHDDEGRRHHLDRLRTRTRQLGALVNQLINHAMVQHRSDTAAPESVDLAQLVRQEMADMLSHQERLLDLAMEAPEQPCLIMGDAISLREAVKNVLGNALQYGAASFLHVQLERKETQIELRVIDDGPGIPEADWERIRKPFSPRSGERMGASLGLSIVEEVMRAHGGQLRFGYSGAGSFMVVLSFPVQSDGAT
ncbi:sensor histidine kinase [Herbaspirillum lusitanum]|uniref:sensor histidine kinase n=1 Tax=Herbaspirillum lusitanum TaxID=213312 RepID=UPI0022370692|nr:sensor histidine kinase N-terminal domain-containing protein [Herbaspirillum lusitanum]MCW5299031.1 sensor histidine kinase [Herbaspirillum lusitanum]